MKKISIILFFLGLTLLIGGAVWVGMDSIVQSFSSVGIKGLLILSSWQVIVILLLSYAWHVICPDIGMLRLIWARFLRESAATCLPFSQVGGILLSIRAVCFRGYRYIKNPKDLSIAHAVSSNIVDITTETLGQIVFIIVGICFLIIGQYHETLQNITVPGTKLNLKWFIIIGIFFLLIGSISLIWSQRQGSALIKKLVNFLSKNIAQQWEDQVNANADSFQNSINQIWSNPKNVLLSCIIHLIGWLAGAIGTWLCYKFLGASINIQEAVIIEAFVCVALSIGFLVPASVGIQEGAYVLLGSIFGIDPHLSFSLSLLRRARDILIGVPTLLLWQITEIHYLNKYSKNKKNC